MASEHKNMSRIFELLASITSKHPECSVDKASLEYISKMQMIQSQRIKDIPFLSIFPPECLLKKFSSQEEALETIYPGLIANTNMENILKVEKFVEKLIESNRLKDKIYFDFILKLPESMKS